MSDATDAIISIHSDYADAILAGTKTVELRRRVPKLLPGTRLWIYATRPTGAVVGFVTVKDVLKAHPAAIWKEHSVQAGIDYNSFEAYFNGSHVAVAITLDAAKKIEPIALEQLQKVRRSFRAPQVLTRLSAPKAEALRKMTGC